MTLAIQKSKMMKVRKHVEESKMNSTMLRQ